MNLDAFASRSVFATPFPHFVVPNALGVENSLACLKWLETDAPWRLKIATFYQQYEFSLRDNLLPSTIQPFFSSSKVEALRECVAASFCTTLAPHCDITAHKLVPGQRIRIHNDYIVGRETHRVLIQLNSGWTDDNGGALLFFGSEDATDVRKAFRPLHDSCVAFEISPKSHHAVTPILQGERYTLVFSFYRDER
ncbi:cyclophane-containing peptide 2OG-Fe(II) oxygenase YhhC [Paraburkholderia caledonica]|uniref:Rps23 Pro-64 3,4-dihydroxylase Tpa1-like proline 4-hydroxylase n=1 Tax=Paraburkholderia caledonica TaxID=134536 RepID=A0AB73I6V0_9BURK|nr:Rps23 Pro-64 3,4-dihydroxylase Tpa1-like proline 4-hydroxylase [Paraburkholderia caledonica]